MKRIKLSPGDKKFIQAALGVSRETVSQALNFRCNTETGKKIRHIAYGLKYELVGEEILS